MKKTIRVEEICLCHPHRQAMEMTSLRGIYITINIDDSMKTVSLSGGDRYVLLYPCAAK